ncbi:uncharacterized protein VTP21DRAFT_8465 [Calcarisporiella thermophila]|uniref:uncharacterized protein n=1 Tax=Calcarisporiella thermophila TaxID=911321 RepID=UPI003742B044
MFGRNNDRSITPTDHNDDRHEQISLLENGFVRKGRSLWEEFKDFIDNGNVIAIGVGLVSGAAFQAVTKSMVEDILSPPIGLVLGSNFENLFVVLKHGNNKTARYTTVQQAQEDGAVTWNIGHFIQVIANFFIVSMALFWLIQFFQVFQRKNKIIKPQVKCKFCRAQIPKSALRCKFCTSWADETHSTQARTSSDED